MIRLGIIDSDAAFVSAILAEAEASEIQLVDVPVGPLRPQAMKAKRLSAALLSPGSCGPDFWADLERLLEALPELSVLVCSGKADLSSRVRGLRLGADDWITKPVAASEVLARVEAAQRARAPRACELEIPARQRGELEFWAGEFDARVARMPLGMTAKEFELLSFLVHGEGRVLERRTIYRRVWGSPMSSGDRSVYTYIRKVRIKLRRASPEWDYIHSLPGLGYLFEPRPANRGVHTLAARPSPAGASLALSPAA
ncbi:MAG: winged helix-turn-helix domain-containing protein [Actinobacteria bacterium]|nr:winged helix-turn-helix domain-containing protein [Actinomycetota bacterium]